MQNDILKPLAPNDEDLLETLNIISLENSLSGFKAFLLGI